MLLKLLKYEFKSTYLKFLGAFAVYIVMSALLLIFFKNHVGLTVFLISAGIFALFAITFLELFQRYNTNLYGSEGYLMFTLPVSSRKLLASKLISAFVWIVALGIVMVGAIFTLALAYGNITSISKVFAAAWSARGGLPPYLVAIVVTVIAISLYIYFSITVSKLPIWRGGGVVMGFVAFFIVNAVQSLPSYIVGLKMGHEALTDAARSNFMFLFFTNNGDTPTMMWVQIGYTLLLCVGLFFATAALMEKTTSLK